MVKRARSVAKEAAKDATTKNATTTEPSGDVNALVDSLLPPTLPKIPRKRQTTNSVKLAQLKAAEQIVQAKQLSAAINTVKTTVAQNNKEDLLATSRALQKADELKKESNSSNINEDCFEFFQPHTDSSVLEELEQLSTVQKQIYDIARKDFEKESKKKLNHLDHLTTRLLERSDVASRAANYNDKLCKQLTTLVNSSALYTRAGQDKLKVRNHTHIIINLSNYISIIEQVSLQSFATNYQHFVRYNQGVSQTAKYIRKAYELPLFDEPSTSAGPSGTSANTANTSTDGTNVASTSSDGTNPSKEPVTIE